MRNEGWYKVLPDVRLAWRDVMVGAIVTALLFNAVEKESELIPATSCRECLIRLVKWCSVRSTCPV